jgi:3-phenylpropionate/trans-cinnamate dioxygenase ferredoxin reductase component
MAAGMVIMGGGMAGARCVINLRANGYDGPITLIGEEKLLPYDRPPLSKAAIVEEDEPVPVWLLDDGIVASLKADVRLGCAGARIDRAAKHVLLEDGTAISYDKLLLATGAKPRKINMPGGEHALLLRDFQDALALRRRFQPGKRIVIIGGGFIGLELAASASKRGCHVTVVEAQPRILMRGVPEAIARIVHERHVAAGIDVLPGSGIAMLHDNAVQLADGAVLPADSIIAGIGAAPETRLAAEAGLAIENGIACNEYLQTSDPDIYAAGDCCSFVHRMYGGRRLRLEAWRSAQEQAATAAENMLGAAKAHTSIPWFWSDQHDLSLQIAGMPDMGPVTVVRHPAEGAVLLFHLAEDGRLMGASGIGPGNSIARDVKLAEMMMAKGLSPSAAALADPNLPLKSVLKG